MARLRSSMDEVPASYCGREYYNGQNIRFNAANWAEACNIRYRIADERLVCGHSRVLLDDLGFLQQLSCPENRSSCARLFGSRRLISSIISALSVSPINNRLVRRLYKRPDSLDSEPTYQAPESLSIGALRLHRQ